MDESVDEDDKMGVDECEFDEEDEELELDNEKLDSNSQD
jgi:hypothetical protein